MEVAGISRPSERANQMMTPCQAPIFLSMRRSISGALRRNSQTTHRISTATPGSSIDNSLVLPHPQELAWLSGSKRSTVQATKPMQPM